MLLNQQLWLFTNGLAGHEAASVDGERLLRVYDAYLRKREATKVALSLGRAFVSMRSNQARGTETIRSHYLFSSNATLFIGINRKVPSANYSGSGLCHVRIQMKEEDATRRGRGRVDECSAQVHRCPRHSRCVDLPHRFRCECLEGFTGNDCKGVQCAKERNVSEA